MGAHVNMPETLKNLLRSEIEQAIYQANLGKTDTGIAQVEAIFLYSKGRGDPYGKRDDNTAYQLRILRAKCQRYLLPVLYLRRF